MASEEVLLEVEKFSSGGFRNAFKGTSLDSESTWVIKTYNEKALKTISDSVNSTPDDHTRKQVQMHSVAKGITKSFASKAPSNFGECFKYNKVYYTQYEGQPATIEEFVDGQFKKYVNNTGKIIRPSGCTEDEEDIIDKAECLVHYSYQSSDKRLMLLDIQGSGYNLYDPEISRTDLYTSADNTEIYFCCGNLSFKSIDNFKDLHACNRFCKMLDLPYI